MLLWDTLILEPSDTLIGKRKVGVLILEAIEKKLHRYGAAESSSACCLKSLDVKLLV